MKRGHLVQTPGQNRVNCESDHIACDFSQLGPENLQNQKFNNIAGQLVPKIIFLIINYFSCIWMRLPSPLLSLHGCCHSFSCCAPQYCAWFCLLSTSYIQEGCYLLHPILFSSGLNNPSSLCLPSQGKCSSPQQLGSLLLDLFHLSNVFTVWGNPELNTTLQTWFSKWSVKRNNHFLQSTSYIHVNTIRYTVSLCHYQGYLANCL